MLSSCATFDKGKLSGNHLKRNNLGFINGTYTNFPSSGGGFYVRNLTDVFDRNTGMFDFKEKHEDKDFNIELKAVGKKRLNLKIYDAGNLQTDKNLRVALKEDGFIYLQEKRFMLDGIPLVFGGWNIQKSRFALDENNNLKVESNYFFCNGILVVMSDWKTSHYDLTFKKQNP
ncbi:hypothetical protein CHA01nite_19530 [Chryseobacterium hagamense]|uniref:Uncharacterized protein n=2 Tax=Chryseobacterium hagamense TaxID=395935 RepID=A0A511YLY9_9FLAO|nr:hypothetical protein CHA01nite_19530 [Chryseobacterium hagamense]